MNVWHIQTNENNIYMKQVFYFFSTILIFLSGCTSSQYENEITYINWDSLKNSDVLSESCMNATFVKLETNSDCVLNDIVKVEVDDSLLFIIDSMERLYVFDKDGTFIRKIGTKGGAENEYVTLLDFVLNREKKQVYLVDIAKGKILSYNYQGEYLGSETVEGTVFSNSTGVAFIDDKHLATINFNGPTQRSNFSIVDIETQKRAEFVEYISIGKETSFCSEGRISQNSSGLLLTAEFSDTIYSCSCNNVFPKFVFQGPLKHTTKSDVKQDYYDFSMYPKEDLLKRGFSVGINNLFCTENIVHFTYNTPDGYYRVFYDIRNNRGYKHNILQDQGNLSNRIWNNIISSSEDAFICVLSIGEFLPDGELQERDTQLDELLKVSTYHDNPIIAFLQIRE